MSGDRASSRADRAVLLELADRCVSSAASWQLDDAIAQAAFGLPPCGTAGPRPYTSTLDGAALLVPETMDWEVCTIERRRGRAHVWVPGNRITANAKTPALALCAAALRARAA